jgi:ABC-type sugar transport system ATPase subunit
VNYPAVNAKELRLGLPSSVTRKYSSWMNRCQTWMRNESSTRSEISKLHQRLQTTFIYVTHDQVEAMTMADRIAEMYKGIIQQLDTPQNLYNRPDNLFVCRIYRFPRHEIFSMQKSKLKKNVYVVTDSRYRSNSG